MDEWGRLLPAANKFPSAADGVGFKPLGRLRPRQGPEVRHPPDARHPAAGRGREPRRCWAPTYVPTISRTTQHLPLEPRHVWRGHVEARRPGLLRLGLRADRLVGRRFREGGRHRRPYHDTSSEIEAIRTAMDQTGRPMVLSLSPGETPLDRGRARAAPRQPLADQRRLLGPVARFAGAVRPPAGTGTRTGRPGAWPMPTCCRSACIAIGQAHHAVHPRRADHRHDALVHRALARS